MFGSIPDYCIQETQRAPVDLFRWSPCAFLTISPARYLAFLW